MDRVGVITFHRPVNHGAVLQSLSTLKNLEKMGFDAEIIDYRFKRIEYYRKLIRPWEYPDVFSGSFIAGAKRVVSDVVYYPTRSRQRRAFDSFAKKWVRQSSRTFHSFGELVSGARGYDFLIAGSDLIWNPEMADGVNPVCFLGFADRGKQITIAYAPSIGVTSLDEDLLGEYKRVLGNFDYLSVRESSGRDLLQPLTDKRIEKVLDPSLLTHKEDWEDVIGDSTEGEPYILSFMLEYSPTLIGTVRALAKSTGLKVYHFDLKNYYSGFPTKGVIEYGPERFLSLVENASFVVTNSFHGCAFSLIFEKDFWCIPHTTRGTRMVDLLTSLHLSDRIITDEAGPDLTVAIDYTETSRLLDEMRKSSMSYLEKALGVG